MPPELAARQWSFWFLFGGGIAGMALAWALPKNPGYAHPFRLILSILFFAGLCTALYALTAPRRAFLVRRADWQYEYSPDTVQEWAQQHLAAIDRVLTPIASALFVFFAATGLMVLSAWPPFRFMASFSFVFGWVQIGAALWLLWTLATQGRWLMQIPQLGNNLRDEIRRLEDKPRTASLIPRLTAEPEPPAVEVTGDHTFKAGGFEWRWDDFQRNAVVFGMTGSGKTLCVLNALLDGLMRSGSLGALPPSALIFDPKGEFDAITQLCRALGRERDLLVLDPRDLARSIRWNPFDSADDEFELASRMIAVFEALNPRGANDAFWIEQCRSFVRHSIALFRDAAAERPPEIPQILELAGSPAAVAELGMQASPAVVDACTYFADFWLPMPQETGGAVRAYLSNMLDAFTLEPYRTLFTGRSTMPLGQMIDEGKILYVRIPVTSKQSQMARIVLTLLKLEYQHEILARLGKPRFSLFFCDEFQTVLTAGEDKGDAHFFSLSRGSRHANLIATQSLQGLLSRAPKSHTIWDLLNNCAIKIFLHGEDDQTNDYAAKLFGQRITTLPGTGLTTQGGLPRPSATSVNVSTQAQYNLHVRPEHFSRLLTPSKPDKIAYTESIAHLATRYPVVRRRLRWPIHPLTGGRA